MTTEAEDDEVILFEQEPNVFLYAFEASRFGFWLGAVLLLLSLLIAYFKGLPVSGARVALLELILYALGNFCLFVGAVFKACFFTIIATNRRVIVRFSGRGMATKDGISIAIEAIRRIETNSYGVTYGSVYFESDKTLRRKNSTPSASREPRDAAVPIKRTVSIWRSMPFPFGLYGFYGFKRFDEFASIVSEQQKLRST